MTNPPPRSGRGAPVAPIDPEIARTAQRLVLHFVLLVLAALVTATLPLPLQVAALIFSIAAIIVGVRALRVVWRPGLRERLAPLLLLGLAFSALLVVSTSVMLSMWQVQLDHQVCLRRALTIGAREACEVQYQESIERRLEELIPRPRG